MVWERYISAPTIPTSAAAKTMPQYRSAALHQLTTLLGKFPV